MYFPSGEYTGFPSNPGCVVMALGLAAGNRNDEQITVRAYRLHFVGNCREAHFFSVWREINISRSASLIRGTS